MIQRYVSKKGFLKYLQEKSFSLKVRICTLATQSPGYEIPVLKSSVCQRIVFAESAATGMTVLETNSKSSAAKEIKALVDELLEIGG